MAIVEAVLQALLGGDPTRGVAASGINHVLTLSGQTAEGHVWIIMDNDFGGVGARAGMDGVDATGTLLFGGRSNVVQMEAFEAEYPVIYEGYALVRDSGGVGAWRGGRGVERTIRLLADADLTVRADRMWFPPPGRAGGQPGRPGAWIVNRGRADERHLRSKQIGVSLQAGDTITMITSGGGGYGAPQDRDPLALKADVDRGAVSSPFASEHQVTVEAQVRVCEQPPVK